MDRRPTYIWPTWRAALLALHRAGRAHGPRIARSSMWRTAGDRPPDLEDFTRLRAALVALQVDDTLLAQLTSVAKRDRPIGDLDAARLRLERGLRRLGVVGETTLRRRVAAALDVPTYSAGKGDERRSYIRREKPVASTTEKCS